MHSGSVKEINFNRDSGYTDDFNNIKKQESQPDLRKTFSNARNKFQQTSMNTGLRFTSHGQVFAKVQAEAKKIEEDEQKNMKKHGISS